MGQLLAAAGVRQVACSETQKFGHVTYFWNGNRSGVFEPSLERYIDIPSDVIAFDRAPEMKAALITDAVLKELAEFKPNLTRLNYANGDMVGHTGNFEATVRAVETVDREVGRLVAAVTAMGGVTIVTADHGNAEEMGERDKSGALRRDQEGALVAKTSHSTNAVPLIIEGAASELAPFRLAAVESPGLANVAATALTLMGYGSPPDYMPSLLELRDRT